MPTDEFPSLFDHATLEAECRGRWERAGIHRFDPDGPGEVFSVDTPPPYVSAAHLHVGHAMSYTQAEFVVRFQRMRGRRTFYPMGFDDNGLPTERHVEQVHAIDRSRTTRAAFRALCLEETARGAATYEALWRSLGLSVDWRLRYSTIDPHCQRTAQGSFVDLHRRGRIYRADEPVAWDPVLGTALAQADLELVTRWTRLHTVSFHGLPIATTRPELLPACVALYRHPDDPRYAALAEARVPLEDRTVPVLADRDVDPAFGTGLLMVCTFGDADDVRRWRRDHLALRPIVRADGTLSEGPGAGRRAEEAREATVKALAAAGLYGGWARVEQRVPVSERTQAPIEWRTVPQWFVRIVDLKERLRARSDELRWTPAFMKQRLDDWIDGLQWDWNISRQRFYGVPFPVWICEACAGAVLADRLPVDPLEEPPPVDRCPACGGALQGDPDVMDTWMTSSLTPRINANTAGTPDRIPGPFPMTVRVQAFEILRTWLFYTLVKAELHDGTLPFRDVMISGWGLDEQGKKISKRNLADPFGFCRYDPAHLVARYGADALRHWAGRSALGRDLRFSEKDVRAGRRVSVKLWNAARLVLELTGGPPGPVALADRAPEDRGLLHGLDEVLAAVAGGLEAYDYASGLHALDRWFFDVFCDDWLEAAKERVRDPERFPAGNREAGRATAWEALRAVLGAYAPYLPFVTEAIWLRLYAATEGGPSLHVTRFPEPRGVPPEPGLDRVAEVLAEVRRQRTARSLPQSRPIEHLVIHTDPEDAEVLRGLEATVLAACRARRIELRSDAASRSVEPVFG